VLLASTESILFYLFIYFFLHLWLQVNRGHHAQRNKRDLERWKCTACVHGESEAMLGGAPVLSVVGWVCARARAGSLATVVSSAAPCSWDVLLQCAESRLHTHTGKCGSWCMCYDLDCGNHVTVCARIMIACCTP
jgi:hypothetical protein